MYSLKTTKATIVLGALLSTGVLFAQQPDASQAPADAPQAAQAAPQMRHQADPEKQAEHLGKKLNLSSDQVAQIKPILADRQQQFASLGSDTSLSKQDRRAKAQQIMQDSKSKIEAVLNDQQKQQFEQMLANRRNHRRHGENSGNSQPGA